MSARRSVHRSRWSSTSRRLGLLVVAALMGITACAPDGRSAQAPLPADRSTLRLAMYADASTMDPDVYYDVEATPMVHALYEGLLAYAPDSSRLVGALATSWTISPDRKRYTFELRHGVFFHDGAPFTSADVVRSFDRRKAVKQPSGYMLDGVEAVETPRPDRVVIQLAHPVAPFLDYLASTWGPKMIGPGALVTHAGGDHSRAWLDRHDDGTGPYALTRAAKGREYVLSRFPRYWGAAAGFDHVQVRVIGDAEAQSQELQNGGLDAVLHGFPAEETSALAKDPRFFTRAASAYLRVTAYVNVHRPGLKDPGIRTALAGVLDPQKVMASVGAAQGDGAGDSPAGTIPGASLPSGNYPPGVLADDTRAGVPEATPDALARLTALPAQLQVAYTADESGTLRQLAEAVASRLRAVGVDAEVRETSLEAAYSYAADPSAAPDLLLNTNTPDAPHPDTWARIVWARTGGLNFLAYSDPAADAVLDQALVAEPAAGTALYREVGRRIAEGHAFLDLADLQDQLVLRADLDGVSHVPAYPWSVDLAALHRR